MADRAVIEWRYDDGAIIGRVTHAGVVDERHKAEAMALYSATMIWQITHGCLVLTSPDAPPQSLTVRLLAV